MISVLFNRIGWLGALTSLAMISLAFECSQVTNAEDTQLEEATHPVAKAEIDWEGIHLRASRLSVDMAGVNKVSPSRQEQIRQELIAGSTSYADLHQMMREGKLNYVDIEQIYELVILDMPAKQISKENIDARIIEDRKSVEGKPAFFTGTWVMTSPLVYQLSSFTKIRALLTFYPNGTYEYAVAAEYGISKQSEDATLREWSRHQGTYQVNPIKESQAPYESNARIRDLYTITFTPVKGTLRSIPELKGDKVKFLRDNFFQIDQPETFRYHKSAENIGMHNLRNDIVSFGSGVLRHYNFKPIKLDDLPHVPSK